MKTYRILSAITMFVLCAVVVSTGWAKSIYVAPGGAGDGSSWASPAGSIYGVLTDANLAAPGDEIRVKGGTYTGEPNWDMSTAVKGTVAQPITIVSYAVDGSAPEAGAAKIEDNKWKYWPGSKDFNQIFDGLDFKYTGTGDYFQVRGGDVTMKNCIFHGASPYVPVFNFDDCMLGNWTFIGCLFYDNNTQGGWDGQVIYVRYPPLTAPETYSFIVDKCTFVVPDASYISNAILRFKKDARYPGIINVSVTNSIFANSAQHAISDEGTTTTWAVEDYNCFFNIANGEIESGKALGPHDTTVDPQFVNAAAFNFLLMQSSPLIGAGLGNANIGWDQVTQVPVELSSFDTE